MPAKTTKFDAADHLKTKKVMLAYLEAAFEDGDAAVIATALGNIARAQGMSQVAKSAGVTREALYRL
jgi:probable addiction module antidote protein